jgi:hypothetical protein
LEHAQEVAREINVASWVMPGPGVSQPVEQSVFVPIGQYQAVMQLLDALS